MKRVLTVVVIAAVIAGALWLAFGGDSPLGEQAGPAPTAIGGSPPRPADAIALTVEHVVDGDTIRATATTSSDLVATGESVRVRLIGIDTPELTPTAACGAEEARDHLRELLPEGARVWAAADREPLDRYGRALLYLWTDEGVFVNHELVASGDAEALRVAPNVAHAELFADAEAQARDAGRGQWGSC